MDCTANNSDYTCPGGPSGDEESAGIGAECGREINDTVSSDFQLEKKYIFVCSLLSIDLQSKPAGLINILFKINNLELIKSKI